MKQSGAATGLKQAGGGAQGWCLTSALRAARRHHPFFCPKLGVLFFFDDLVMTMRSFFLPLFVALAALSGAAAQAQTLAEVADATELAKTNGCLSCHAMSEKIVGPAYSAVAEKYKGDKDAVANLVQSIQYGSKGKWGRTPMPAHNSMSQADLKTLAVWVMNTKH